MPLHIQNCDNIILFICDIQPLDSASIYNAVPWERDGNSWNCEWNQIIIMMNKQTFSVDKQPVYILLYFKGEILLELPLTFHTYLPYFCIKYFFAEEVY